METRPSLYDNGGVGTPGDLPRSGMGGTPCCVGKATNVRCDRFPGGDAKPDKVRAHERIDGISALVIALGRALLRDNSRYIYQGRTLVVLE